MAHQLPALVVHAVLDADENMAGGVLVGPENSGVVCRCH